MNLNDLGLKFDTDKSSQDHNYLDSYENALMTVPVKSLLEIGIAGGQSLRMWGEFFPFAKIVGTDISGEYLINEGNISSLVINQNDVDGMRSLQQAFDFDVIVDDGSHYWGDQLLSFFVLFPNMKPGSIYIMEDVHTSFHSFYNDGKCNPLNIFWNFEVFNLIRCVQRVGKDDNSISFIIWRK